MYAVILWAVLMGWASGALAQAPPTCEQQLAVTQQYVNVLASSRNQTEGLLAQTAVQVAELQAQIEALKKAAIDEDEAE